MTTYKLEKKLWKDTDFEQMGWHDCHVYKIRVGEDLELDIDYILRWNAPELEGLPFTFWVAPATLVFKNVKNLSFELNTAFDDAIEIEDIERAHTKDHIQWTIISHQGDFEFIAEGYKMFIRQEPFFEFGQTIAYSDRNGFSLARTTDQDNPIRSREDILEKRTKNLEHYENVKKRHLLRMEREQLDCKRAKNEIDTKEFLLKKKEIKEQLDYYDYWLKGTIFEHW